MQCVCIREGYQVRHFSSGSIRRVRATAPGPDTIPSLADPVGADGIQPEPETGRPARGAQNAEGAGTGVAQFWQEHARTAALVDSAKPTRPCHDGVRAKFSPAPARRKPAGRNGNCIREAKPHTWHRFPKVHAGVPAGRRDPPSGGLVPRDVRAIWKTAQNFSRSFTVCNDTGVEFRKRRGNRDFPGVSHRRMRHGDITPTRTARTTPARARRGRCQYRERPCPRTGFAPAGQSCRRSCRSDSRSGIQWSKRSPSGSRSAAMASGTSGMSSLTREADARASARNRSPVAA